MAVEIPVVVDIESAFADAAKRAKTAIKPLQDVIESAPASLFIDVKVGKSKKALVELFDDAMTSVSQYQDALNSVNAQIDKLASKGGFNLRESGQLTAQEKNLLEAAGLLETKLRGVGEASSAMGRIIAINMKNAEVEIQKYMADLDKLQRKQNLNARPSAANGLTRPYQAQIDAVNVKLQETRRFLAFCSMELDNITKNGLKASSSMSGMKTAAQEMADAWMRGEGYLARYNEGLATSNFRLGALVKSAVSLAALHSATGFIRNVREVTAEFEMQRVALGGIIQDTERAEELFRQLKAAALQSPFEIKDLVSFTKQLSAYRIETENLFDVTMKLADVSAGLGVDMSRLVLAYGQVRAASVLRGQELRQFTEAGIPLVELLADKFNELGRVGTTTADVFELISERAVPFKMIEDIFNDMTSAGGLFYKMQEKQSETLKGQWMKLKDALSIMYDEIGNTTVVHGAMEMLIKDAMNLFQNWREVGKSVGIVVASMAAYKVAIINARIAQDALTAAQVAEISALRLNVVGRSNLIAAIFGETAATKAQIALSNLYVAAKRKEYMATNLFSKALWKVTTAMLANPYALALAGVVALVAAIVKLTKRTKEAAVSSEELQKSIASFDKAKDHVREIEDLCRVYDELSQKANKTKEEEEKLTRVTKELAKSYPGAITGANAHTKSIELNTTAIREQNEAVREAIRLSLLQDKESAEKGLGQLQSEYDRISEILSRGTVKKGAYGGEWFEPITAEERAQFGARLLELENEMAPFKKSIDEANKSLDDFKEGLIGPPLPDFFGDAWRGKLNSFSVTLKNAISATKAFQKTEIEQFKTAQEAAEETASRYEKQNSLVQFYTNALKTASGAEKEQFESKKADAEAIRDMYASILSYFNAWDLVSSKKPSGTDSRLSNLRKEISEITNAYKKFLELRKYMSDSQALNEIGILFPQLKGWEPSFDETIKKLQQMRDDVAAKLARSPKDKTLWEMQRTLDTEISNLKFDDLKKKTDDELKRISDEIKRSETARNFYQDILGLTGDEDLATTMTVSVYGDVGEDFKDRIKKQLVDSLSAIDAESFAGLDNAVRNAFDEGDYEYLVKNLDKVPEKLRDVVKQVASDAEKYNADVAKSYAKLLLKYDEMEQQRVNITNQASQDIKAIEDGLALERAAIAKKQISEEEKARLESEAKARANAAKGSVLREKDLQLSRLEREYRMFFSSVGVISDEAARKVAKNQKQMLTEQFNAGQKTLAQYKRELREIEEQLKKYENNRGVLVTYLTGGSDAVIDKLSEYSDSLLAIADASFNKENGTWVMNEDDKAYIDKMGQLFGGKLFGVSGRANAFDKLLKKTEGSADEMREAIEGASESIKEMGSGMSQGLGWAGFWVSLIGGAINSFDELAQHSKNSSGEVAEGWNNVANILMKIPTLGLSKDDDAWERFTSMNDRAMEGFEKFKSGNIIGALIDVVYSWVEMFDKSTRTIDRQIKEQSDLVDDLKYQYDRLGVAIDKAFGQDYIYNYNKQMEVLQAQAEAYRKQAELERSKGKKADEETAKGYEKSAREIEDQMEDMRSQLSEFFAGTDVTSAATDFAQAWIEAYKQFGSTTDAMREKFQDMLQNMIQNSLAAKIMQSILQPLFDEIDEMSQSEGELSASEIAKIAADAPGYIDQINNAMTTLMSQLAASGYDVRQQMGQFTGISRNIAGASEESITGLAAGINTQNFYISHIDATVTAILSAMTGGSVVTNEGANGAVTNPYQTEMLLYAGHIPTIDQNLSELLSEVRKVIKPRGTAATHYVATNL